VLRDSSPLAFSALSLEIVERNWIIKQDGTALKKKVAPRNSAKPSNAAPALAAEGDVF
jgi:hypothetical protein